MMDVEQITTLHRAAGQANVIAEKCASITDRIDLTDPLNTLRMIGEISVGLGMVAEAVRDACEAIAVEAMVELDEARRVAGFIQMKGEVSREPDE